MQPDRASAEPPARPGAAPMAPGPARAAEPPAAPTEAEPAQELGAEADTQRAPRGARHTAAAHTVQRAAARKARVANRMLGAGRTPREAQGPVAEARRNRRVLRRSATRWLRMDSCLLVNQSARDQPSWPKRACSRPREVDYCSRQARGAELVRRIAKEAARGAALRTVAGPLAVVRPRQAREGAVEAEREGRHEPAQAEPLRPMDCRKTGKTCWWAGSRRRTACTRSCEKLPSSSYGALTCASLAPGSIPVLPRHYAAKGRRMCSETIGGGAPRLI